MSFVAAGIAAAATVGGSLISSSAASSAGRAQADAANRAADLQAASAREQVDLQREIYNQQRADIAPYRQAGLTAQNRLLTYLGLDPSGAAVAPVTQFDQRGYDRAMDEYYASLEAARRPAPGAVAEQFPSDMNLGEMLRYQLDRGLRGDLDRQAAGQLPVGQPGAAAAPVQPMARPTREQFTTTIPTDQLTVDPNAPDFGKYARDFSMADFQADPGYAFRLSEGLKALDRQAAARGGLISGAALKASQRYGQDMASQEYGAAFDRYQINRANQLNPLMAITGYGQLATNQLGSYGSQFAAGATNTMGTAAANQANALGAAGQARASGYVGQANALTAGLSGISNLAGQYFTSRQMGNPYGLSGSPSIYGTGPITTSTNYFGE